MNPLDELMKRLGAFASVVLVLLWFVLPSCPCQWQKLVGAAVASVERGNPDSGVIVTNAWGDLSCCCHAHPVKTAHDASSNPSCPKAKVVNVDRSAHFSAPRVWSADDALRMSGKDPPPPEPLRIYLRWQVFLA